MNKKTKKSLLLGSVFLFGSIISSVGYAASVPCSTAKLIVPWKAGGGTHVLFSIFEKTWHGGKIQVDIDPVSMM